MKKLAAMLAFALGAGGAFAQDSAPPPLQESPAGQDLPQPGAVPGAPPGRRPLARPDPGPVTPFQAGSFLLYPEIVLTGMYDDNVFSTQSGRIRDYALIVSPALWVQSNWQRHFASFTASADLARYRDETTEDSNDYRVGGEGRYDFGADSNVYGGLRFAREHEDRESPEARNGVEPTRYRAARAYAGALRQFGAISLRAGANLLDLDFKDVPFVSGSGVVNLINNDDRDRRQIGAGVRAGYEITPRVVAFVQASVDNRRYVSPTDDLGFARDSDGTRVLAGVRTFAPGRYKLEAFAGRMRQDYDDARLPDVSKPALGANLVWNATPSTTLGLFVDRTIEETTVFTAGTPLVAASAYVNTYGQVNVNHRVTPVVSVYAFGSASRADYQGIVRTDDYYTAGLGGVYRVAKSFFVDLTYQHRRLRSEIATEDFRRNQWFVRLAFPFSR